MVAKEEYDHYYDSFGNYNNYNNNVASATAPLTTMASAIFFGAFLFASVALLVDSMLRGDSRALLKAAADKRSTALDVRSYASVYTLLHHCSVFGLILFYAYLCEYHPPYPHSPKSYDRDEFFFLTALLIVVSFFTLKCNDPKHQKEQEQLHAAEELQNLTWAERLTKTRAVVPANDATEVLNRDQTEEWKGWMQFMFLLYHYHHAEEVYNAIRVMITCYVWMTGFGNFSFFYVKGDYGSVRVMQMLWRLNFLVVFLCLTQGTTYILYYICLLHTYYFLMVYTTMRIYNGVNYTVWGARIKMVVLAAVIFLVWDVHTGIFRIVHWPFLGQTPVLGATLGPMWEWYFRSTLDHWSTYMGMIFALNFPITSLWFRKLEAQSFLRHFAAKLVVGIAFAALAIWWVTGPFMLPKFEYNKTNAYYAWIPLIAYIYFRNLTPWLRNHTLDLLHQIGKTTLETYLMQHHIWLTSDAKSLLTLIPGWPKMNFLVVTVIYVTMSRRLYQLTLFLRGMVLPNNRNVCIQNLVVMVASIGSCVLVSFLLRAAGYLHLFTVGAFAAAFGYGLYRVVLSTTVTTLPPASMDDVVSLDKIRSNPNCVKRFVLPPALGGLALLCCGAIWHHAAQLGAGKIKPLPQNCADHVHGGDWVPVDTCNGATVGELFRLHGTTSLGTCSPQTEIYNWGWDASPSAELCRFQPKPAAALLKSLNHRRVTFIGDSVIRHLYFALCRQLGDSDAGAYNTTVEKWSHSSRQYKNVAVEFKWAPFTPDLIEGIQNVTKETTRPDLVIVGGGAWDRLHRYRLKEDLPAREAEVKDLAGQMQALRQDGPSPQEQLPVVWVVPTTINTWALMTDDKRDHIREDQMAVLRNMYEEAGIHSSADFVLDGPAFTAGRVSESYDGVHYPFAVYDAGAQILANAMDWLIRTDDAAVDPFVAPTPGTMANPLLGGFVLLCAFVGIFLMDGFLGLTYLAGIFVPGVRPRSLFNEAYGTLHAKLGLPAISLGLQKEQPQRNHPSSLHGHQSDDGLGDDELDKSKSSELQESGHELETLLGDDAEKNGRTHDI